MKIGYYVQGDTDEAVVWGLAKRWCPDAELVKGPFRGSTRDSLKRELRIALSMDLKDDKGCDILVFLTDADANPWRDVKRRESKKIPDDCQHLTLFGVAEENIECWLAIDLGALARELECQEKDIPKNNPSKSNFIKRRFGLTDRDTKQDAKARICDYVAQASLKVWIEKKNSFSDSFEDFYEQARDLAEQNECSIPNERESGD